MVRMPLVTILAREMRLTIFVKSTRDGVRSASHDIGTRNAIENFWHRPTFGDVVSAASHNIGTRNAIENKIDQALEILRVPLVTILAREMRLKYDWNFFEFDQALEMLRAPLVTKLVREMWLKIFLKVVQVLEMVRVPPVTILAREMWLKESFCQSRGDVASATSRDIGARYTIESFFNHVSCQ